MTRTNIKMKAKALRTHCVTGVKTVVDIVLEKRWYESLDGWSIWIIEGGVTGYESFMFDNMDWSTAWSACAGTRDRWDELLVSADEMKKIYEEMKNDAS